MSKFKSMSVTDDERYFIESWRTARISILMRPDGDEQLDKYHEKLLKAVRNTVFDATDALEQLAEAAVPVSTTDESSEVLSTLLDTVVKIAQNVVFVRDRVLEQQSESTSGAATSSVAAAIDKVLATHGGGEKEPLTRDQLKLKRQKDRAGIRAQIAARYGNDGNIKPRGEKWTAEEAGRKGGFATRAVYGHDFYSKIGNKGGSRVRELIAAGRTKERK